MSCAPALNEPVPRVITSSVRRGRACRPYLCDSDRWTYWSSPISEWGPLWDWPAHIQVRITLESEAFADFVRLDSLWVETAPLLAHRVVGEVALLEQQRPARGIAEVELGRSAGFTYDLSVAFSNGAQRGFDTVYIRTGNASQFKSLSVGGEPVDPVLWKRTIRVYA